MRRPNPDTSREAVAERTDRVRRLTRQGVHSAEIARKLDITQRTVVRLRARLRAKGLLP